MNSQQIENYIQLSGELFETVQSERVFPDSKQFVDMVPVADPEIIIEKWKTKRDQPGFDLSDFINEYFELDDSSSAELNIPEGKSCREHIQNLWPLLFRKADTGVPEHSSLLPLPREYVVPGGRFREIYYWDSYFTAQGLIADGHKEMVLAMAKNFAYLVEKTGHVPNGNRVYYLNRSQPPFFVPMADLVISNFGQNKIDEFLPAAVLEYKFWMDQTGESNRRTVSLPEATLNRYWDDRPAPREESWFEDVEIAKQAGPQDREQFYRHIRAACESGWDFTSRWFNDGKSLSEIETTNILPVDLNTLIWFMEKKLSEWCADTGRQRDSEKYKEACSARRKAINKYMWDSNRKFYFDWNIKKEALTECWSLAAVYPLYFKLASQRQAEAIAGHLEEKFLKPGGLVTTTLQTGEQWDAPNGWAPLQWLAVNGLQNYGFNGLAAEIRSRWLKLNRDVYNRSGKMVEKYNVLEINKEGGGGEYPLQDGFGWTNGVFSALSEQESG